MANKQGRLKEFVEERDKLIQELEQRGREITTLNLRAINLFNERMQVVEDLEEQEHRLSALLSAVQAVSQSLDLREVLNLAAAQLMKSLEVDRSFIYLMRGDELILTAGQGFLTPELKEKITSLKLGGSLAGRVALTGESISIEDVAAVPGYNLVAPRQAGIQSLAAAALRSRDEIRGVVGVATLSRRHFTPKDVELLETLGLQIGIAIEKAELVENLKDREEKLALIAELTRIITSSPNINEVYENFAQELKKLVDFDRISIALIEGDALQFFAVSPTVDTELPAGSTYPLKNSVTEWVAEHKTTNIEADFGQERQFPVDEIHLASGLKSAIRLPLFSKGEVFGTLNLTSSRPNAYGERERWTLEQLAAQISGAIENARLYALERQQRMMLEQQEREKIQFIATITHELRTPLTPIIGSGGLLAEELQKNPDSVEARLIENVMHGAHNLEARLHELIDMAKGQLGTIELQLEPVDLRAVLQDMMAHFLPVAQGRRQNLRLELPKRLPVVKADRGRLEQILLNLLTNAAKFTLEGGSIVLRAKKEETDVVIEVEDTGSGISEEEQERLFEPYYRIEADRQRFPGLGLGMALSNHLVGLHGGKMWVKSELGKGSTFSFSLPLDEKNSR